MVGVHEHEEVNQHPANQSHNAVQHHHAGMLLTLLVNLDGSDTALRGLLDDFVLAEVDVESVRQRPVEQDLVHLVCHPPFQRHRRLLVVVEVRLVRL